MNKDNITNFSDLKKKADEKSAPDEQPILENELFDDTNVKDLLSSLGIQMDDSAISEMLSLTNVDEVADFVQSGKISFDDVNNMINNLREIEDKFKKEKKTYRAFSQWVPYHKPYDLSTMFSIEHIQEIANYTKTEYGKMDSKNAIIEKLLPSLPRYFEDMLKLLDTEMMSHLGNVIYSDGKLFVDTMLSEEAENQIDYLQKKALLARVNEHGAHCLVIPKEFYEIAMKTDFATVSKFNALNSKINKTVIAFANSYGAYPKHLLYGRIKEKEEMYGEQLGEKPEEYIDNILSVSFMSKQKPLAALYPMVMISDDYIHHGMIEFTRYLIDIQNENIKDYKNLSEQEIETRGNIFFFEDSIYLKQAMDILTQSNSLDQDEMIQLKNLIYIFSYLEFEPSLIMQMLDMRYILPEGENYHKLLDILKNYYKNGEKWILKGHTSFEVNNKNSNFDASKIVKLDFIDK